ncbi:MAG TPA: anti-sigma factor antagonist [Gaiellaceae bacterium]|nr:anti-sigma factor antagonist [Gaiellaceae bacterium]
MLLLAEGELDAYAAPDLEAELRRLTEATGGVLDLSAVSFLDSTALGVLVRACRQLPGHGCDLRVVLPRGTARRIFEITALDRVLPVETTREAAVAALSSPC